MELLVIYLGKLSHILHLLFFLLPAIAFRHLTGVANPSTNNILEVYAG